MAEVPLRDYLDSMRAHLREGQFADVMALGQHILRYYPKHIETYRMLGEASLETNDLVAAVDLFQRVRSADPENIIALAGLSAVHEQRKEFKEAIWHLERAFEIQPANTELRKELLRLHAESEGTTPDRLKLTPGGLARLYTRQGLYPQAIQEFRSLLKRDPSRTDIQAALAETLYRVGRKQEAAEVAQALLEKLPYCLKANLLLGALWSENGVPEAETLMQRARSMDPEYKVARGLLPDHWDDAPPPMVPEKSEEAAPVSPPAVAQPPELDESGAHVQEFLESLAPSVEAATQTETRSPRPATIDSGFKVEPPVVTAPPVAAAPEPPTAPTLASEAIAPVLPAAPVEQTVEQAKPVAEPDKEQPAAASPAEEAEEKPALSLAPAESTPVAKSGAEPSPAHRIQPGLPRVGPTIPGALDKLPAWVRGVSPSTTADAMSGQSGLRGDTHPAGADRASALRMPHLEKSKAVTRVPFKGESSDTELPDWLTRARQAARSGEQEQSAGSSTSEEKPAWLTESNPESAPTEGRAVSPDWLRTDSSAAASDKAGAEDQAPLPAWLAASEAEGQTDVLTPGVALPDWLSGPKQEAEPEASEASAPVPAWLQPSGEESPPESQAVSTPSPERQPSSPGESQSSTPLEVAEKPPEEQLTRTEIDETIPEWLREISAASEVEPAGAGPVQSRPSEPSGAKPSSEIIKRESDVESKIAPSALESEQAEPNVAATLAPAAPELVPVEPGAIGSTEANVVEPDLSAPIAETGAGEAIVGPEAVVPSVPIAESVVPDQTKGTPDSIVVQARELWKSGDRDGAIGLYEKALQKGPHLTAEVIADLEQFVQEPGAPLPAHRLLGDAYSMVGKFKEALEQYRIVLGK